MLELDVSSWERGTFRANVDPRQIEHRRGTRTLTLRTHLLCHTVTTSFPRHQRMEDGYSSSVHLLPQQPEIMRHMYNTPYVASHSREIVSGIIPAARKGR